MKQEITVKLDQKEILEIVRAHIADQGYFIEGDLHISISDSIQGGFDPHDGDYQPAKINYISATVTR